MICENCNKEYYNLYGSGRFCCEKCARSFSSKFVNKNELKEAKCVDCNKIIYIKKRASSKYCKCEQCKIQDKVLNIINSKEIEIKQYGLLQRFRNKIEDKILIKEIDNKLKGIEYYYISKGYSKYQVNRKSRKFYKLISPETKQKLVNAGLKSCNVQSEIRRSRNEIYFCKLCEDYFNNVRHNEQIFNGWDADIIIDDIKVAILWNGKWHYQKIKHNHSVKQVQNRDKIKLNEIKKLGYVPYIIKDMGRYNKKFVEEKFNEFLKILSSKNYIINVINI